MRDFKILEITHLTFEIVQKHTPSSKINSSMFSHNVFIRFLLVFLVTRDLKQKAMIERKSDTPVTS